MNTEHSCGAHGRVERLLTWLRGVLAEFVNRLPHVQVTGFEIVSATHPQTRYQQTPTSYCTAHTQLNKRVWMICATRYITRECQTWVCVSTHNRNIAHTQLETRKQKKNAHGYLQTSRWVTAIHLQIGHYHTAEIQMYCTHSYSSLRGWIERAACFILAIQHTFRVTWPIKHT